MSNKNNDDLPTFNWSEIFKVNNNRLFNNIKILALLEHYARKYPDLRFIQILKYFDISLEDFYEESIRTLAKIETKLASEEINNEQSE